MVFSSQIVHEEGSFLGGGAEKVCTVGVWRQEVDAAGYLIALIFQRNMRHILFSVATA